MVSYRCSLLFAVVKWGAIALAGWTAYVVACAVFLCAKKVETNLFCADIFIFVKTFVETIIFTRDTNIMVIRK